MKYHVYEMPICESHVSLFTFISHAVGEEKIDETLFVANHRLFKTGFERSYGLSTKGGI